VKALVSYSSSADSRVFSARCVTILYYLLLSISVTNFMSNLKRALITELLWTQSRRPVGFGAVSPPQTKLPAPKLKYEIL